jgi:hypothetical protein
MLTQSLRGNSDALNGLAIELYARGLSVCDVEDALRDATGQLLVSRNAVSAPTALNSWSIRVDADEASRKRLFPGY